MRKIQLESKREFHFALASFSDARALYQLVAKEVKGVKVSKDLEVASVVKDIVLSLISSEEIAQKAMECSVKCLYGADKDKVNDDLFEDEKAREDYIEIMTIVIMENIKPFTKTLMQKYEVIITKAIALAKENLA